MHDGLVAYRRTGGGGGTAVVPDLATALPEISDSGRTYTFSVRRGVRFSDGRPVRPTDIEFGIERAIRHGAPATGFLGGIKRVTADDASSSVVINLAEADPDFLYKLAWPFASAVPASSGAAPSKQPLPTTGPYRIASFGEEGECARSFAGACRGFRLGRSLRLERNPYFEPWAPAAKPDGYADVIEIALDRNAKPAVADVRAGRADWVEPGLIPISKQFHELRRHHADQLHTAGRPSTIWFFMNTRRAPFDRLGVRRAVNLAIDRRDVAATYDAGSARPTCQILAPELPGYVRYCPFGTEPDLARARRLVRESGTEGMRVTVHDGKPLFTPISHVLVRTLRRLGYRTSTRTRPWGKHFEELAKPRTSAQIGAFAWFADYPAPSNFIEGLFTCAGIDQGLNPSQFCDPTAERLVRQARRLQPTQPREAAAIWSRIDRRVVDQAPAVPLVNLVETDLVSARAGNWRYHPVWGALLDQLWVR
jgi:peptide/nickel transport system substrate-binding protein